MLRATHCNIVAHILQGVGWCHKETKEMVPQGDQTCKALQKSLINDALKLTEPLYGFEEGKFERKLSNIDG